MNGLRTAWGLGFRLFPSPAPLGLRAIGAATFAGFMLACPWLPGDRGITKALSVSALLGTGWAVAELLLPAVPTRLRADLVIAMVTTVVYGSELGGLSSVLPSDLDPLLARLGIGAIGNVAFAGTVRTDLLNNYRTLEISADLCSRCGSCAEVCPLGLWSQDRQGRAQLTTRDRCTACTACLTQCPSGAIQARQADRHPPRG